MNIGHGIFAVVIGLYVISVSYVLFAVCTDPELRGWKWWASWTYALIPILMVLFIAGASQ